MPSVVLIVTGKMEHAGLIAALQPIFPSVDFTIDPPDSPINGFTSSDICGLPNPADPESNVRELAARLVAAAEPGRRSKRPDLVVAIEDLELINDGQPGAVVDYFRQAVKDHVRAKWSPPHDPGPVFDIVREHCSFHLLRPMTEAYFFADPDALRRAKIASEPILPSGLDLEQFQTADPAYSALPTGSKPIADAPIRERHPKSYLHYLCDPTLVDRKRRYKESQNGVAALRGLDWSRAVVSADHCPFLRAFLDDLAFAVHQPLDWVHRPTGIPTAFPGPSDRILRNC